MSAAKKAAPKKPAAHPTYKEMIGTAIKELSKGSPAAARSGCSKVAISNYISANFKVGDRHNALLKASLLRGIAGGSLVKRTGLGCSGSFKLAKPVAAPKKKPAPKKAATPKKKVAAKKSTAKRPAAKRPLPRRRLPSRRRLQPRRRLPPPRRRRLSQRRSLPPRRPNKRPCRSFVFYDLGDLMSQHEVLIKRLLLKPPTTQKRKPA